MSLPRVVHSPAALSAEFPPQPGVPRVVVMTMGALHEGHLALVRRACELAGDQGQVLVTIYVNPLQFAPHEDFENYPRDIAQDVSLLTGLGVDVVYAPSDAVVYPDGDPLVRVSTGRLGEIFEGAARPGHFDGVATVVLKLLHITAATDAIFGQKDAQQLLILRRMVTDFNIPTRLHAIGIVREKDGLARSSRNSYLSANHRADAAVISQALFAAQAAGEAGSSIAEIVQRAHSVLETVPHVVLDYLELVDPATVEGVDQDYEGTALLLVAARVGGVRLLDNMPVNVHRNVQNLGGHQ